MSFFGQLRPPRAQGGATVADGDGIGPSGDDDPAGAPTRRRGTGRVVATWVATTLGGLLVLFALVAPNQFDNLTPGSFLRLPVEALVGLAVLLVLPSRARRITAAVIGVILGLLTLLKIIDMGFFTAFARPFDPLSDWFCA